MSSNIDWIVTWLAIDAQPNSPSRTLMQNRKHKPFGGPIKTAAGCIELVG
jgi:hypothetical protein